jgi:mRNA deadenylase 3'-5' endonuclease subunit Ccr4
MEKQENSYKYSEKKEKQFVPPKTHQRFLNKRFPFNFRYFVPEMNLENMHDNPDYIRVVNYNILCDSLITISTEIEESDFLKYPYMQWEERKRKIVDELKELNGDIICLQELERDEDLIKSFSAMGYDVRIYFYLISVV